MKQSAILYSASILLPLALTAPMPQEIPLNIIPGGFPKPVCDPSKCHPGEFPPPSLIIVDPIIGYDPRICNPVQDFDTSPGIMNNIDKRSPEAEPAQHSGICGGIGARADISTTPPTRPVPEPDAVDKLKARSDSVVGNGLTLDGADGIVKRSRDPPPEPDSDCPNCLGRRSAHWTKGIGPRLGALEKSGTGVNNGKRDVDDAEALILVSGTEIGNGIVIGSKDKRGIIGVGGGSASTAHWGVGDRKEVKERSIFGVGTTPPLDKSSDLGDAVFRDWV